uniref:SAC domain-containing protein n=1 Tax=Opuntia streptacantha TaxID=393608 RepID=A0A7C9EU17_OPUST
MNGAPSYKMTSAVQIRGSIPLSWSQKPAFLNIRPRIKVSALENSSYQPTQLHFINLHRRYRRPIIILNLVKKRGNESRLSIEFRRAIDSINMVLPKDDQLKFLRFDLDTAFRTGSSNCTTFHGAKSSDEDNCSKLQQGILRTNCIDSLDRTNVAQYVYGLVALGHQLHSLEINGTPNLDLNHGLAYELMSIYEAMGDALAHQYGGSAAQNKIFAEFRGQCKLATRFLLFIRKVQRHCSNSFRDFDKQKAIDMFLGPFQQEDESPASSSDSYQPRLQRTASDSEVLRMPSSDLGYLSSSLLFSTPRWCAPVGRLRFDIGSPDLGGTYFRSTGNYFTDTDENSPLLWSQWSESEYEQELYESEDEE